MLNVARRSMSTQNIKSAYMPDMFPEVIPPRSTINPIKVKSPIMAHIKSQTRV